MVPAPSHWLASIPPQFVLTAAILIGSVILVCLVLFHGIGIHYVLAFHKGGVIELRSGKPHILGALFFFGVAVFLLLSLHIIGVIAWAAILTHLGIVSNASDAIYFCANAYTTLGYGTVDLDTRYRIISPIIGISGLFTFAWTTSALVTIVTSHTALIERLHEERLKQKQLRLNLKEADHSAREREREAERHESIEITQESMGAPLYRRWQLWRDDRQKIRALRAQLRADRNALHRKEQAAEDALGVPPSDVAPPAPASKPKPSTDEPPPQ
ncbi:MAG: ion channel [Candidatus Acidiferrales bacterium]